LTYCQTIDEAILAGRVTTTSGLACEFGFSRHFIRYHFRGIERLGFVWQTMMRVLVTRKRLVPTGDPA
jgi:predicted transcriptional regulator